MKSTLDFHGLAKAPFDGRPGRGPVFATRPLRGAVAWLTEQIDADAPLLCVHGETRIGRSSVARALSGRLVATCRVARVFDPRRSWPELRFQIADQLMLDGALSRDALVGARTLGDRLVLVADAAELAGASFLEHLDEVLSLRGPASEQLMQVVLFVKGAEAEPADGQESLRIWRWLAERRAPLHALDPLSPSELPAYIARRLEYAGLRNGQGRDSRRGPLFGDSASLVVHRHTRGVPRRVGEVCDAVLREAARRGTHEIDARLVADTVEGSVRVRASGQRGESVREDHGAAARFVLS